MSDSMRRAPRRGAAVLALALVLPALACDGIDDIEIPALTGPSALALDLYVTATPDILVANGFDTSTVRAQAFDQNGQAKSGVALIFTINDDEGRPAQLGRFVSPSSGLGGGGTAVTQTTNSQGVAEVRYEAPERREFSDFGSVVIKVRPVGTDANAAVSRAVRIELITPEPRRFPENPNNTAPTCSFRIDPPGNVYSTGQTIRLFSTAVDPPDGDGSPGAIVRYRWDFGDGTVAEVPDPQKAYGRAGGFTITHTVTDEDGAQASCTQAVTIR